MSKIYALPTKLCYDARIPVQQAKAGFIHYVYILQSKSSPDQSYIGSTSDLRKRLAEHNAGKSIHTNKFKPWALKTYVALPEKHLAEEFERYLKSGSGRAFAKSHLLAESGRNP
ncbi:MAG: GIY-YIG nuclease family protein [Candidatus Acidiferrales bacterium]|jgi:predicted GIY-YIG superfamily endonuclease